MGLLDFLKVDVVEKKAVPNYTAHLVIDGKNMTVANLGTESVTVSGAGKLAVGQTVSFDISLKDPKEKLQFRASGPVLSCAKGEAKIGFTGLSQQQRLSVARFLARYMMGKT